MMDDDVARYDPDRKGYRIFVGDLGHRATKNDVEREFEHFGPIVDIWIARNPPGFAFVVFKYAEDAERAVRRTHGERVCGRRVRVQHARPYEERREALRGRAATPPRSPEQRRRRASPPPPARLRARSPRRSPVSRDERSPPMRRLSRSPRRHDSESPPPRDRFRRSRSR